MPEDSGCRIIIVGGGIIGLTTACTILKEYSSNSNLQLSIIGETFTPNTTGDTSGGFWEPYGLNLNDPRILKWAGYTYNIFMSEYFSSKADQAGLIKMSAYIMKSQEDEETNDKENFTNPSFVSLVRHYRVLDKSEIEMFQHLGPIKGFAMSSIVAEVKKYLPQLERFLKQDSRIKFIKKKIHSFSELKDEADVVINCCGLGARELVGDHTVRPARGQIIRVRAPWIKSMYYFETKNNGTGYIIPQTDFVILGGTFQLDDWNTTPIEKDTNHIRHMCGKILPALNDIKDGYEKVGLRPYRDGGVRLEHERTIDGIDVVHCYGHSGSGVTLSWGCAKDITEIVKTLLPNCEKQSVELPEHEQLWRLVS